MKISTLKAEVTVAANVKVIALIITMLDSLGNWQIKKVLTTVAAHYDLRVIV